MSSTGPQIEALRSSIAFRGLSENDLQPIAARLKEESHPAGTVLIDIDEKVDRVFLIIRGKVRISRFTSFGEETTLNTLSDGNIVGEFGVVDDRGSSARVTCAEQSLFYTLSKKDLDELLTNHSRVSRNIMREFTVRVRQANDNVVHQLEVERSNTSTQLQKLSKLIEASRSVNSTLDLEKLLGLILDAAVKSTDADRGTVYLIDSIKNELWSKVLGGENMIEIHLPIGKGIAGYVAQTGETINIPRCL